MLFLKKIYRSLALRCFGALAAGVAVVTVVTLELAQIGLDEEFKTDMAESQILRFPENEESLRAMSASLMQDLDDVAATIEPAAGE